MKRCAILCLAILTLAPLSLHAADTPALPATTATTTAATGPDVIRATFDQIFTALKAGDVESAQKHFCLPATADPKTDASNAKILNNRLRDFSISLQTGQVVMTVQDSQINADLACAVLKITTPAQVEYDENILLQTPNGWLIVDDATMNGLTDAQAKRAAELLKWAKDRTKELDTPTSKPNN